MSAPVRRVLFSLALLLWSAVMLYFHSSGRIQKYLAPDFRPILFVGGLGLAVVGLFNLLTAREPGSCGHDAADDPGHDHEATDLHPVTALLLMVLPVGLSVAWTKDEYSAAALARKGLYDAPSPTAAPLPAMMMQAQLVREDIEKSHRKTPDGYHEFNLLELFFAIGDRTVQPLIDGMKIETEGRWVDEKANNPQGRRKRLYRLFITCCAADSRAIPIVLEYGAPPPVFPENGWVKVAGTMGYPLENGVLQPVLRVERTLAADPPFEEHFLRY